MKGLQKVCGESWYGLVTRSPMQLLTSLESLQVSKHEIVALPANRNDGT